VAERQQARRHQAAHHVVQHDTPAFRKMFLDGSDRYGFENIEHTEEDEGRKQRQGLERQPGQGQDLSHHLIQNDGSRILAAPVALCQGGTGDADDQQDEGGQMQGEGGGDGQVSQQPDPQNGYQGSKGSRGNGEVSNGAQGGKMDGEGCFHRYSP